MLHQYDAYGAMAWGKRWIHHYLTEWVKRPRVATRLAIAFPGAGGWVEFHTPGRAGFPYPTCRGNSMSGAARNAWRTGQAGWADPRADESGLGVNHREASR